MNAQQLGTNKRIEFTYLYELQITGLGVRAPVSSGGEYHQGSVDDILDRLLLRKTHRGGCCEQGNGADKEDIRRMPGDHVHLILLEIR